MTEINLLELGQLTRNHNIIDKLIGGHAQETRDRCIDMRTQPSRMSEDTNADTNTE